MSKDHKAKALVISCIDFRFQEMINQDLTDRGLESQFDRIAWPSASRDFDNVLQTAKLSLTLHDPDELYIYEHEDCKAYGQDNSEEAHRINAQRLADALKQLKPTLTVTTLMATFDGIFKL